MRVSVDKHDPGYHPGAADMVVTLNGEPFHFAITADENEGLILTYERGPDGKIVYDRTAGEAKTVMLHGVVSIYSKRNLRP